MKPRIVCQSIGKQRSRRGVTAGTLAGLLLLIGALVSAVAFLLNAGVAFYYREKLNFVTNQVGQYVVSYRRWNQVARPDLGSIQEDSQNVVSRLCREMSLPTPSISLTEGADAVRVSVHLRDLHLPASNGIVPSRISMDDDVRLRYSQPPAWVNVSCKADPSKVIGVPCYGIYTSGVSDTATGPLPVDSPVSAFRHPQLPYQSYTFAPQTGTEWQQGFGPPTKMEPSVYLRP